MNNIKLFSCWVNLCFASWPNCSRKINDFCLFFELIQNIFYFFRAGETSGKRRVYPTGKGFDMPHYLN